MPSYFNPPSPCGEGLSRCRLLCGRVQISIHPPRAGRDTRNLPCRFPSVHFNPPSPCGEGHRDTGACGGFPYFNPPSPCGEGPSKCPVAIKSALFQSTLPVRGGTTACRYRRAEPQDFNPPSPCGEGLEQVKRKIRAIVFQSTLPGRGGTPTLRRCGPEA